MESFEQALGKIRRSRNSDSVRNSTRPMDHPVVELTFAMLARDTFHCQRGLDTRRRITQRRSIARARVRRPSQAALACETLSCAEHSDVIGTRETQGIDTGKYLHDRRMLRSVRVACIMVTVVMMMTGVVNVVVTGA